MEKKKVITILILVALCAVILVFPLMTIKDSEFGGADGAAEEAIAAVDPDYEPWAERASLRLPAERPSPCSSACKPPWVPSSSASALDTWWPGKSTGRRKPPDGAPS